MKRENYAQIVQSILIAIAAILCGYFIDPMIAVLGLLISASYVGIAIAQHRSREVSALGEKSENNINQLQN